MGVPPLYGGYSLGHTKSGRMCTGVLHLYGGYSMGNIGLGQPLNSMFFVNMNVHGSDPSLWRLLCGPHRGGTNSELHVLCEPDCVCECPLSMWWLLSVWDNTGVGQPLNSMFFLNLTVYVSAPSLWWLLPGPHRGGMNSELHVLCKLEC